MTEERSISIELATALRDTQEQLRQTMSDLSEVRSGFRDLSRMVSSAENERSITHRLWVLERQMSDLINKSTQQTQRGWEIRIALIVAILGLGSSVIQPVFEKIFQPSTQQQEEPYFPPGEGEPLPFGTKQ